VSALPFVLIFLAFPVTPLLVNWLQRTPEDAEPGVGARRLAVAGTIVRLVLLVVGFALLVPRWL